MNNEQQLKDSAPNLLYAFLEERFVTARNFGKSVEILRYKRQQQMNFIKAVSASNLFNNDLAACYEIVKKEIVAVYGKTPQEIMYRLAKGETVFGKNWEKGLYGIGATSDFSFNPAVSQPTFFDNSASNLGVSNYKMPSFNNGKFDTGYTIPNYYSNGIDMFGSKLITNYNPQTGTTTSFFQNKKGELSPFTISNGSTTLEGNGLVVPKDQSMFWNNLNNSLVVVNGILKSIVEMFAIKNPTQVAPSQVADGWVKTSNDSTGSNLAGVGIIGALLLGGVLLSGNSLDGKNKKKK